MLRNPLQEDVNQSLAIVAQISHDRLTAATNNLSGHVRVPEGTLGVRRYSWFGDQLGKLPAGLLCTKTAGARATSDMTRILNMILTIAAMPGLHLQFEQRRIHPFELLDYVVLVQHIIEREGPRIPKKHIYQSTALKNIVAVGSKYTFAELPRRR